MHLSLMQFASRSALLIAVAACASSGNSSPTVFVAANNETVGTSTEVRSGDPPAHIITITNRSSVPITVWNMSFEPCENLKGMSMCGPRNTNVKVPPNSTRMLARLEPANVQRGFTYHFRYAWRADSSSRGAIASALTQKDPALARLNELSRNQIQVLAPRIAKIKPDVDSIVMEPGQRIDLTTTRVLVLTDGDSVLGSTRAIRMSVPPATGVVYGIATGMVARRPGRAVMRVGIAPEFQAMLPNEVPDVDLPIVVAYKFGPDSPTISGKVIDKDNKKPLACTYVAVEDTVPEVIAALRTDATGTFSFKVPKAGQYQLRVDADGWLPWRSPRITPAAGAQVENDVVPEFADQAVTTRRSFGSTEDVPARVQSIRFDGVQSKPNANTPVIYSVSLGGSQMLQILDIKSPLPPQTVIATFVVDQTGRADTTSLMLPAGTNARVAATVRYVLPRVGFYPPKDGGKPACDLVRMPVNFTPR